MKSRAAARRAFATMTAGALYGFGVGASLVPYRVPEFALPVGLAFAVGCMILAVIYARWIEESLAHPERRDTVFYADINLTFAGIFVPTLLFFPGYHMIPGFWPLMPFITWACLARLVSIHRELKQPRPESSEQPLPPARYS